MPPRAQRLYPRMRERPLEIRINKRWPMYHNLIIGIIPQYALAWPDNIRYTNTDGQYIGGSRQSCVTWSGSLSRLVYYFNGVNDYVVFNPRPTIPERMSIVFWYCPLKNYNGCTLGTNYDAEFDIRGNYPTFTAYYQSNGSGGYVSFAPFSCPLGSFTALAFVRDDVTRAVSPYKNGVKFTPWYYTNSPTQSSYPFYVGRRHAGVYDNALVSDVLLFAESVSESIVTSLADPSNVDLRVGNIPLLLPPRRRLWPVAPVAEAVFLKRRSLGLRAGTREAVI